MDVVESLAAAIGMEPRFVTERNWAVVEQSLGGLRLPSDYKRLVDGLPHGKFKELVTVVRPGILGGSEGEYLGHYEWLLEDLRRERDSGYGSYPYPIYPEKGGLLPWGDTPYGQLLFWLTENEDPDTWPVVWADEGEEHWHLHQQSMSEFLLQMVTDPPAELVGLAPGDLTVVPAFRSFDTANVAGLTRPSSALVSGFNLDDAGSEDESGALPIGFSADHADPEDESGALLEALGVTTKKDAGRDWDVLAAQWGVTFPTDYRVFLDSVGPGLFCDLAVFGPDAPEGWNLTDLLRAGRQAVQAAGQAHLRFHPDPGGIVPWGMTQDGWLLGWLPENPDPDLWQVTAVGPGFHRSAWPELSFSEFLLYHSGVHEGYEVSLPGRPEWTGPPVFQGLDE